MHRRGSAADSASNDKPDTVSGFTGQRIKKKKKRERIDSRALLCFSVKGEMSFKQTGWVQHVVIKTLTLVMSPLGSHTES